MISGKAISESNGENIRERASLSSNLSPSIFNILTEYRYIMGKDPLSPPKCSVFFRCWISVVKHVASVCGRPVVQCVCQQKHIRKSSSVILDRLHLPAECCSQSVVKRVGKISAYSTQRWCLHWESLPSTYSTAIGRQEVLITPHGKLFLVRCQSLTLQRNSPPFMESQWRRIAILEHLASVESLWPNLNFRGIYVK
jgi:hypothetical protein